MACNNRLLGWRPGIYESKMAYPISSPGVNSNEPCDALRSITTNGQNILETLGAGHGGRVKLAQKYHKALEASISRNFQDNGIISCMSHNTDGLYR